jgi:hypothetical protein
MKNESDSRQDSLNKCHEISSAPYAGGLCLLRGCRFGILGSILHDVNLTVGRCLLITVFPLLCLLCSVVLLPCSGELFDMRFKLCPGVTGIYVIPFLLSFDYVLLATRLMMGCQLRVGKWCVLGRGLPG